MILTPPEKLSNGLEVLINPRPLRQVCVAIAVRSGSAHESPETNGSRHFVEHLLFEGTEKLDSDAIKEAFIINKDDFNADTYFEATRLYFNTAPRKVEQAIKLLSDMLLNSTFDDAEVEAERGPIVNEIMRATDRHQYYLEDASTQLLFEGQRAGMPIAGTKKNVLNMTRDELFKIYRENYTPQSIVVSVYGGVKHDRARALLERYFGGFDRPYHEVELPDAVPPSKYRRVTLERPGILDARSSFEFALPGTRRLLADAKKDISAIRLLGYVIDSKVGDRLEDKLMLSRRHLTDTSIFQASSFSLLSIDFGSELEISKRLEKLVLSEIEKLRQGEISARDFNTARAQYLTFGREIQDNPFELSPVLAEDRVVNRVNHDELYSTVENDLSLDDFRGAAQKYLNKDKAVLLTLVPSKKPYGEDTDL